VEESQLDTVWIRLIGHVQLNTDQFDIDQVDTARLNIDRLDIVLFNTKNIMYTLDFNYNNYFIVCKNHDIVQFDIDRLDTDT